MLAAEYMQALKNIGDHLAAIGHPIEDYSHRDLPRDLGSKYMAFSVSITTRLDVLTFVEVVAHLYVMEKLMAHHTNQTLPNTHSSEIMAPSAHLT